MKKHLPTIFLISLIIVWALWPNSRSSRSIWQSHHGVTDTFATNTEARDAIEQKLAIIFPSFPLKYPPPSGTYIKSDQLGGHVFISSQIQKTNDGYLGLYYIGLTTDINEAEARPIVANIRAAAMPTVDLEAEHVN